MSSEQIAKYMAEKYCPSHNEIGPDESHFHCEECADAIKARFEKSIIAAIRVNRQQEDGYHLINRFGLCPVLSAIYMGLLDLHMGATPSILEPITFFAGTLLLLIPREA